METRVNEAIQTHYTRADLGDVILAALEKAGKNVNRLVHEDLAPIDQFHIRGRTATLELARAAGLDATKRVLDVGSGVGGTSRCLAKEFGCRVTGIDLTDEYCRAATMLTAKTGLAHLVDDLLQLFLADAEAPVGDEVARVRDRRVRKRLPDHRHRHAVEDAERAWSRW